MMCNRDRAGYSALSRGADLTGPLGQASAGETLGATPGETLQIKAERANVSRRTVCLQGGSTFVYSEGVLQWRK